MSLNRQLCLEKRLTFTFLPLDTTVLTFSHKVSKMDLEGQSENFLIFEENMNV